MLSGAGAIVLVGARKPVTFFGHPGQPGSTVPETAAVSVLAAAAACSGDTTAPVANAISGTFSNLPDGGIVTINGNNLQANCEGGDGNDLTLTVVP